MRETAENDAARGYSGLDFGFDEGVEVITGFEDTGFVLSCLEVAEVGLEREVLAKDLCCKPSFWGEISE